MVELVCVAALVNAAVGILAGVLTGTYTGKTPTGAVAVLLIPALAAVGLNALLQDAAIGFLNSEKSDVLWLAIFAYVVAWIWSGRRIAKNQDASVFPKS